MEADGGKSVPVLKEFQMEALLAPVTPAKPMAPGPRPIHPNRQQTLPNQDYVTPEAYLSRFTQQNPAEMSANLGSSSIQFEAGHADWGPLYRPTTQFSESSNSINHTRSEMLFFSKDDGVYENGGAQDPLAQWSAMRFSDLLAMNNRGATASSGNQPAMTSTGFFSNLASQFEPMNGRPTALAFENQDVMRGGLGLFEGAKKATAELNKADQFNQGTPRQNNQRTDVQQSGFSDTRWKPYDLNFHPNMEDAVMNGNRHANATNASPYMGTGVFAPATPDPQKGLANKIPMNQNEIQFSNTGNDFTFGIQETQPTANSTAMENYDRDGEGNQDIDLNKTIQQKPRRKKHRPKVIKEGKPKRTPKQRKSEPSAAGETPKPKRKYARKNKTSTPSATPPEGGEAVDSKIPDPAAKSCRRSLNFDLDDQVNENSFSHGSASIPPSEQCPQKPHREKDVLAGVTSERFAYDVCPRNNQMLKEYLSMQEGVAQNVQHPTDLFGNNPNSNTCASSNVGEHARGLKRANFPSADTTSMGRENMTAPNTPSQINHVFLGNSIFSGAHGMYFPTIHKKRRTEKLLKPNTSGILSYAYALENIRATVSSWNYSGEAAKSSKYYYRAPHISINADLNNQGSAVRSSKDSTVLMNWADIDKLKKKRSKAPTRVRNLDSLKGLADRREKSKTQAKQKAKRPRKKNVEILNSASSMQALAIVGSARQTGKRKPRKKTTSAKSITSSFDMLHKHNLDLVSGTPNSNGTFLALPWIDTVYVDAIIEGMRQLNINKESSCVTYQEQNALIPYHFQYQQQNALVPYQRDGTMIPFEGTQATKRRQRAKVDLDDETSKVWRLLLEDINNQGIDGTDEEKAKWWENERKVFRGRVDSFIARMRLVQGDRRFSPWKGSVVDSVVGVFLTQNVSDHLSSSAFMSLASRFPIKAADKFSVYSEEKAGPLIEEPEISVVDLDENSEVLPWSGRIVQGPVCDMNSRIYHDIDVGEDKVVDSKQLHGSTNPKDDSQNLLLISQERPHEPELHPVSGTNKESEVPSASPDTQVTDDVTSSLHSVISSQNSVESPRAQASGKMGLSPDNSSEGEDLTASTLNCAASFVELIKMAETPMLHTACAQSDQKPSYQSDRTSQKGTRDEPLQKATGADMHDSLSAVLNKCSAIYQLHPEEEHPSQGDEESRSVSSAKLSENFTAKQCETAESTGEFVSHEKAPRSIQKQHLSADNVCSCYVLEGDEMVIQSLKQPVGEQQDLSNSQTEGSEVSPPSQKLSTSSGETVTESTCASNSTPYTEHKNTPPRSDHNETQGETSKALRKTSEKQKTGRNVKKAPPHDWDSLRKQTRVDGQTRRKTDKTMDSLDWEAVRCADVKDIADTIKERGMNNVLAERIQEFLNRLVKDHGSIDLEWLRDVPPDKAKEYLLSVRGLGLKSVECVRLLTLHHLAFPVDTNVGRIAVRLGWVPLQPLPESLQLHLLELYPILESIQKYLWPRLCKLDQRTLYELHYHMITFGKVFCTKKQPNCNACPLRGECRHFASAFASARLALPGPEDKSIVPSEQSGAAPQDPKVTISPMMSLPMPNQISETKADTTSYEPIVEIPASPEPERTEALECDIGDIEDLFNDDPNEIPTIRLNMEEFTNTLQTYMQANMELQGGDMSRALVALAAEAASIPTPKLKNVSRLRTEHHVYELPDTHQLVRELDRREPDDPCSYLLAIWSPGETANSTETPQKRCSSEELGQLCFDETCSYCNSQREANSQVVRGTLLIPCRTAMRGSFPLNGTYFQVNEVFADHDSSLNPIEVPRTLIWNLPRRTVYFGTSIPTIFKGLTTEDIQHCFWKGYVCVRGFDQRTRAPRPLMARLHYPASKMVRPRGRNTERDS